MDRRQTGVRPRGQSIQVDFYYQGIRCRETLKIPPTKANIKYAENLKATIQHEITLGLFDYSKHFPDSSRSSITKSSNKKLIQLFDEYIEHKRKTCEPSTWRDYKSAIEHHLKPEFGEKYIHEISTSDIRTWISTLDISNKRINNILVPLRGVFADAHIDGNIELNPMDRIKNLKNEMKEPDPFTPKEVNQILSALPLQARNLVQFAFWTGLRTSELIALEWKDIDWKNELARIRRASVRKHTKAPKTRSGERDIKLLPLALDALKKQKKHSFLENKKIFHNPKTSKPWETDGQIRKTAWIPALKLAGVRYRNPYQTRHTYASMLLSAGENPLWVAQQMGHRDWGMIRKTYGRWIPEVDTSTGSKIEAFWSQHGHKGDTSA